MAAVTQGRVAFANQLRGVAALCVVAVHYVVVYQLLRPAVSWVVAAPPYEGSVPALAHWLAWPWFDGGAFGVALFFLISGFVIPFSLAGATPGRFLLARALRIFPTFWAGLALQYAAVAAGGAYWGRPIVFGWQTFLLNGLLVNSIANTGSVDWVSWTLSVEVKFYLLMALLRAPVLACRVWPLVAVAGLGVAFVAGAGGRLPPVLVDEAVYLVFMQVGVAFHYHFRGALRGSRLLLACIGLATTFALCWRWGPNAVLWPQKPANYGYALLLFAACYALRHRFGRARLLDALAAISYPLYLVHAVFGFTVISFMTAALRVPYALAAPAALLLSGCLAYLLHRAVELPTIRAGRAVARAGRAATARPALTVTSR